MSFRYVFLGLSLRSSWGNGHASTYRSLLHSLAQRGHEVTFLERDQPSYAENRDLDDVPWAQSHVYESLAELHDRFSPIVHDADLVVVGSCIPDGIAVGRWALDLAPGRTAFYDIDTPITLGGLVDGTCSYLSPELVARYALHLSCTGGPTLDVVRRTYGAQWVRPLYCSVDVAAHFPEPEEARWDLGYLGTYSDDRRLGLERLLHEPARLWPEGRFVVASAAYPTDLDWPANVERKDHIGPSEHRRFYGSQRFTLNVTRKAMAVAGWSPSVRLFEAAACATPIVTDPWPGLDELLAPGSEILVVRTAVEALRLLRELPEAHRIKVGEAARRRILAEHTSQHRAETLERYTRELLERRARRTRVVVSGTVDPGGEA
ncbi:MAG: glycosyltransferase [Myxococcales bacterium 68-20]|nr:glycosyltransferase [Myxococcales bacterium]OJY29216.1 MAG: glycosyltransferase [Myxococcales bacterium 68-20]